MQNLILLFPPELTFVLIIASGIAFIFGARTLGASLLGSAIALPFLSALIAPIFDILPTWLLVILIIGVSLGLLRLVFDLLIGKNPTDQMVGTLAADFVRAILASPFRLLRWFVRLFIR